MMKPTIELRVDSADLRDVIADLRANDIRHAPFQKRKDHYLITLCQDAGATFLVLKYGKSREQTDA